MKKILLPIVVSILWATIMYFLFAFTLAEINPMKWSWDARYFLSFFGFGLAIFAGLLTYIYNNE